MKICTDVRGLILTVLSTRIYSSIRGKS